LPVAEPRAGGAAADLVPARAGRRAGGSRAACAVAGRACRRIAARDACGNRSTVRAPRACAGAHRVPRSAAPEEADAPAAQAVRAHPARDRGGRDPARHLHPHRETHEDFAMNLRRIPAVYMRGGTSKGVFFHARDLPRSTRERDALLLRVIGSPDPYGKHTDGLGGATSSTSKVVLISPSTRDDCDVDFLFGAVSIGEPLIDWSGNCGNLSAAVGPFAIAEGLVAPVDGLTRVRIWQQNIGQRIDAFVPVRHREVLEDGAFIEDGVPFPGAEIRLEFLEPQAQPGPVDAVPLLPSGAPQDELSVPGLGAVRATMITAGNPTVFVR